MMPPAPLHAPRLALYFRDEMAPPDVAGNYSKSPTKPRRFVEFLRGTPVWRHVELHADFAIASREDLELAHEARYVAGFLAGTKPHAEANGLTWSPAFRDSVLHTNGGLLAAVTAAVDHPEQVTMAPVSGFHHARPEGGAAFCTFSGQVIVALRLYRDRGLRGAWIDLDGHEGNSIEDSRTFAPDLDLAIPVGCNINPSGTHASYLRDLGAQLQRLGARVVAGEIDYVCVAHGADSHEWDQLGHQCSTAEWLGAADLVYRSLRDWSATLGRPVPVTLALFGGYRDDHPDSVLGLHAMDTARCLAWLAGLRELADYYAEVRAPGGHR